MNRRQSLLSLSAVAAHVLFPDVLAAFAHASAAPADAPASWTPEFLPSALGPVLAEAVDTILPETDTPGAKAAGVHVFVDLAAKHCLAAADQRALVTALERLGPEFATLPPAERAMRLEAMERAAFATLRELTTLGYFTSEVGCTKALAYAAVPGAYEGCVDLKPGQKAWATR
jgi:hypothetical protein